MRIKQPKTKTKISLFLYNPMMTIPIIMMLTRKKYHTLLYCIRVSVNKQTINQNENINKPNQNIKKKINKP